MHEHSDKVQPKKLVVTVVLAIALFGYAWYSRSSQQSPTPQSNQIETNTTAASDVSVKSYKLAEVSSHNLATDCWMAIDGKVYDVTSFVSKHPGGPAIVGGCGKNATVLFNERPTNDRGPHPAQARTLLPQYEIGTLAQ